MTKPFNIHDWQAKRAKQLLNEADEYQKRQDAQTPGKNPEYFYDKDSIIGKLKKDPDYIKKLNAKTKEEGNAFGKAMQDTPKGDTVNVGDQEFTKNEHHNDENFPGKDLSAWDLLDKIKDGDKGLYKSVEAFMKSMDSEPPKANDSMWTQTSTADTSTDTVEPEVEKEKPNWRNYRENATGEGASMTGGPGMGHFGKKKNK